MWETSHAEVNKVVRSLYHQSKRIITVFFNRIRQHLLNILPGATAMECACFAGEIIGGLEASCYPEGRIPHERRVTLHFDKPPSTIQNVSKRK
jgi:hypothetical protein